MTNDDKYKVISLLQQDMTAKEVAADTGLSYASILVLRREYEAAVMNNTVSKLINMEEIVLAKVTEELAAPSLVVIEADTADEEAKEKAEELKRELEQATAELTTKLAGLELLSEKLQYTATAINTRVNALIVGSDSMAELECAAKILCQIQTAFVNTNSTQVNVQNNFGDNSTPKYAQFLSDTPGG
jgi:hypothetical protein